MSGLLGFMAAGAAQGYAQERTKEIAMQQDFDLKTALLEAQTEKEMMLQERGIKLKEDAEQRGRDKVTGLISTVKDPMEGKGGYEPPEAAEKRTVEMARQKADKLREAGYFEEAKSFDSVVDQYNKGELNQAKLENEITKINNALTLGREKLESQGDINEAKKATALAKLEAANNKKTDAQSKREQFIEAYGDNPEYVTKSGKLTAKGFDKLNKLDEKEAFDEVTETIVEKDKYDNPIKERRVKTNVPKSGAKVGRYVPGKGIVYDQQTSGITHNTSIINWSIVHEAY